MAAITRVNELGAIVDISQLSKQAALQAIELSWAPVLATHSNVMTLSRATRNLSDEEIDQIGATGGVVHVAPFRGYLFDSSDPQLDADIRAARRAAGVKEDYLYPFELYWEIEDPAAQAEFLGAVSALLEDIGIEAMLDHIDYIAKRVGAKHVCLGSDYDGWLPAIPNDMKDCRDIVKITQGLIDRGYSDDEIGGILYRNAVRVFEEAWSARDKSARP